MSLLDYKLWFMESLREVFELEREKIMEAVRNLIVALGYDPNDENFKETPRRVTDFFEELLSRKIEGNDYVHFTQESNLVIATGIVAYSLCPHHLLPVVYTVDVAYIPAGKVVGVSKLARLVADEASSIQLQETFTERLSSRMKELVGCEDVFVVVRGEHFCMRMRGIKSNAVIITSAISGRFKMLPVRIEALQLMGRWK